MVIFLLSALAMAQPVEHDRTLRLTHTESTQSLQELATLVRTILEIREFRVDTAQQQLILRGTSDQIAATEWLVARLDRPAGASPEAGKQEYRLPEGEANVIRVFPISHANTTQKLQEAATALRSTAMIRRLFTYPSRPSIVVRGSESEARMAEWMVGLMDRPAAASGRQEYRAAADDVVRVFALATGRDVMKLQQLATVLRAIGDIRQMFTYAPLAMLVTRGTPAQMEVAEWLLGRLDVASIPKAAGQYRLPGHDDDAVQVFYLAEGSTVERLQEVATAVRSATQIRRIFTYGALRAIAARGTSGQLAVAQQMSSAAR